MNAQILADRLAAALTPYLGAFNAKVMVKTIAQRSVGVAPEALTADHMSKMLEALGLALCTFVGRASADALVDEIRREVA